MKAIKLITLFIFIAGMNASCSDQSSSKDESQAVAKADDVQVYYFHYARRCATCRNVEAESKSAVETLYGDKVSFAAYNLESADGEQKAEELGIYGQTLLIVNGDAKIDLTNEGFMHASSNPGKLKQIFKKEIDLLINE